MRTASAKTSRRRCLHPFPCLDTFSKYPICTIMLKKHMPWMMNANCINETFKTAALCHSMKNDVAKHKKGGRLSRPDQNWEIRKCTKWCIWIFFFPHNITSARKILQQPQFKASGRTQHQPLTPSSSIHKQTISIYSLLLLLPSGTNGLRKKDGEKSIITF